MRNAKRSIVCALVLVLSGCSGGGSSGVGGGGTSDLPDGGATGADGAAGADAGSPQGPGGPAGTPAAAKCAPEAAEYTGLSTDAKVGSAPAGCPSSLDASGTLTLTMTAGEAVVLGANAGAITANGVACGASADVKSIVLNGTTGDDTLIVEIAELTNLHVDLGGGTDVFQIKGTPGADYVAASAAQDGRTAFDTTADGKPEIDVANGENFVVSLGAGDDVFGAAGALVAFAAYGGAGNDTLTGGVKDDALCGGAGDDTFRTAAAADGADQYEGGDGNDTAEFALRAAPVGITLDDVADDGEKDEHDDVRASTENVVGGAAGDRIVGNAAANRLSGGAGDDYIFGGAGDDALFGGDGDDTFDEGTVASGADAIDGGSGSDTVSYARRTAGIHVALCEPAPAPCLANNGELGEADKLVDVENAEGGSGDDALVGNSASNTLSGNAGDDHIDGQDGDDYLYGDDGADALLGGNGDDYLDGARQLDAFNGGSGDGDICVIEQNESHTACELY